MRILIHGSAPWSPSGYSIQTGLFAPRLQERGHEVAVACWFGLQGGAVNGPMMQGPNGVIPLYPAGHTPYSFEVLPAYYKHWEADLCISIVDAWVCEPEQAFQRGERWVPLFPVDCAPLAPLVKAKIVHGVDRYVISRFGEEVCREAGVETTYVPAAFDAEAFTPDGPVFDLPSWEGKYVIGVVAANKGLPPRKSWNQIFEGFAMFAQEVPEAHLHVHSTVDRRYEGPDLRELSQQAGVQDRVSFTDQLTVHLGMMPTDLAEMYRRFDVLLNPAMGEGFCVPLVEAQGCGTPVIAGDWTAMPEVTKTGVLIPKSETLAFNYNHPHVTYQWIPQPSAVAEALRIAYERTGTKAWPSPEEISGRVAEYAADRVVSEHLGPAIERLDAQKVTVSPNRATRRRAKISGGKAAAR